MRRIATFVVATSLLAGCSGTAADSGVIVLDEYSIDVATPNLQTGPVPIMIENAGDFSHTLIVTRADGSAVTATETIAPGASVSLTVDLEPGKYQVSCRIVVQLPDGTIIDHYEAGMLASLTITED